MWLILLIPVALLIFCFRLFFISRKGGGAPSDADEELTTPSVATAAAESQEKGPPDLKPISNSEAERQQPEQVPPPSSGPLPDYDPTKDLSDYHYPPLELLIVSGDTRPAANPADLEAAKNRMINLLTSYQIGVQSISISVGPSVSAYEVVPGAGTRVSRFKHLEEELNLGLGSSNIRIVAPIPGKGAIGIEVPNKVPGTVGIGSILATTAFQQCSFALPIAIGRATDYEPVIVDLTALPHLLVAGATGQGKSTGLHAIIVSLLYKKHPAELKLVLMDPQKIELGLYRSIEKHFLAKLPGDDEDAVVSDGKQAVKTLNSLCGEMDRRHDLLHEALAHEITEYNGRFKRRLLNLQKGHEYLPYIVLVAEDFSDLLTVAAPEVEAATIRLAERGARVGIHLIISLSRLTSDVLHQRLIEHFPARMAYKLTSIEQSKTVLGEPGAEQLLGNGDLLFKRDGTITRVQGAFIDTPEVARIANFIGSQRGYPQAYQLPEYIDPNQPKSRDFDLADRDPLFEEAARLIVVNQLGSTSLIQRKMKLGYNRAGRLMEQLEAAGVVGPGARSLPRDVLIKTEMELNRYLNP